MDLKYSPYFHAVTREESVSDSYLGRLKKDIKVDQINLDLFSLSCRPNKPQTTALEPPEQLKRAQAPRFTIAKHARSTSLRSLSTLQFLAERIAVDFK